MRKGLRERQHVLTEYVLAPLLLYVTSGTPQLVVLVVTAFVALAAALLLSAVKGAVIALVAVSAGLLIKRWLAGRWEASVAAMRGTAMTTLMQSRRGVDGIGVFATRRIARGERLFKSDWSTAHLILARPEDVEAARPAPHVAAALERRWFATRSGQRLRAIPADANAWSRHSPRQYMNAADPAESGAPSAASGANVAHKFVDGGSYGVGVGGETFVASRTIEEGEELLLADPDLARPGGAALGFGFGGAAPRSASMASVTLALSAAPIVRLGASEIHGVGIFAARPIFAAEQFQVSLRRLEDSVSGHAALSVLSVPHAEVTKALSASERDVLRSRYAFTEERQATPQRGFDEMTAAQFFNHDGNPNVVSVGAGFTADQIYRATRAIGKGEELTINYAKEVGKAYHQWVIGTAL